MAQVSELYRYPVKGLSPEPLDRMEISRASGLPFDREYALALGTTRFDSEHPEPLDKGFFLMLRNNEQLAALTTRFDPETGVLAVSRGGEPLVSADLRTPDGRAAIEAFMEDYLGAATKGRPRLVQSAGHKFTDASVMSPVMMRAISVINLASVQALSSALGRELHPLRFRGNIYLDGLNPWEELGWVDREIEIGGMRFRGLARTPRCGAVNVNPDTAERDENLPKALQKGFGHTDLGIYLEALDDGEVTIGDCVATSG
ncbi:MOSC domain-containing protein [Terrihabitans sp. B22-R8]|uniref:MOSC domain-containing protein n=1 Tax=Terrihabitans sp. B22-R8 TaxID=3425128 RepID=UPI00403C1438